jgi:hypothetical protein
MNRRPMYMADWIAKLDGFVRLSEREVLKHAGRISHDDAITKAEIEYDSFAKDRADLPSPTEKYFEEVRRVSAPKSSSRLAPIARRMPCPEGSCNGHYYWRWLSHGWKESSLGEGAVRALALWIGILIFRPLRTLVPTDVPAGIRFAGR